MMHIIDIWNNFWAENFKRALQAIEEVWSIICKYLPACNHKRLKYPSVIRSWCDGNIAEIPFYTSGFL